MKNCLINQPVGLGDILWVQPIVDSYISQGYEVWYPVKDIYLDQLKKRFVKPNLHWVSEDSSFPIKEKYSTAEYWQSLDGTQAYLPLTYADRFIPNCSVMMSKYYFSKHPLTNWHTSVYPYLNRDYYSENRLIKEYNLNSSFILVNENFGTYPSYSNRKIDISCSEGTNVHRMNIEQDLSNGFVLFDWLFAIEQAEAIHTVETSFCYLVDMYSQTDKIHMYEKRKITDPINYYRNINMVYRNKNWTYHE